MTVGGRAGFGRDLSVVLGLALALRAVVAFGMSELPLWTLPEVDALVFHESAQRVAGGDLLLGHDVLRVSPGYFYFLGAIYACFGDGPWAFRLAQLALGLLTIAVTWRTAHLLFGRRIAFVVGVALALYEPLAFYENLRLGETLAATLTSLVTWRCVARGDDPAGLRPVECAGIGVLFGLLGNLRPNALALALPLAWLASRSGSPRPRARVLRVASLLTGAALALAPIVWRNHVATSELTLVGHLSGINLYIGNAPGATGSFHVPPEVPSAGGPEAQFVAFQTVAERAMRRPLAPKEVDSYWRERTVAAIVEDPGRWLALMVRKTRLFFNGRELSDVYDYELLRAYSPWLGIWALQFRAVAPFCLVGLLVLLVRRERAPRCVAWLGLTYAASVIAVFVGARFRLPILPVLFLGAGGLLAELTRSLKARAFQQAGSIAFALLVAAPWTWPADLKDRNPVEGWFALGQGFERVSQLGQAEQAYRTAISVDPDHAPSRGGLARLYERSGRPEAALRQWRRLRRRAAPDSPEAARAREHIERLSR